MTNAPDSENAKLRATPATTAPVGIERVVQLAGRAIPYTLRVSARARRLRLVIRPPGALEVVAPRNTSQVRVVAALHEKAAWVLATLDRIAREAQPAPLATGASLAYAGRQLTLAIQSGAPAGHFRAHLRDDTLTLTVADGAQQTLRAALETWYRRQARELFRERLDACNALYGFPFGRVAIKEQKSRWGSCSRAGNLNFNWRLLLAPLPVLDYVVVHELCHLRELNHSPDFWRLVARGCPDYAAHRRWLRQHGRTLRF
ncbi:MAG: M48 family metallopeptidase [Ktedonobacterales bacterium]